MLFRSQKETRNAANKGQHGGTGTATPSCGRCEDYYVHGYSTYCRAIFLLFFLDWTWVVGSPYVEPDFFVLVEAVRRTP